MSFRKTLLLLAGALSLGTALASDLDFTLVNKTGRSFEAVYLSASDDPDWDGNLLPNGKVLAANGKLAVKFEPTAKAATWDLKVVDSDGLAVIFKNVNLAGADIVSLTGRDGEYRAEVE
jgi:hypothetical protein